MVAHVSNVKGGSEAIHSPGRPKANDKTTKSTKMIEDMVQNGEAMYCPNQNLRVY